jgi:hypothetical protein
MWPKPRKGKSAPKLPGTFHMYMLKTRPFDVLVSDPSDTDAAPDSNRAPYVLMHVRKPEPHVVVPEPTTAVDVACTPTDAPPKETTPEDSLEEVRGLVERLSLPGAATAVALRP